MLQICFRVPNDMLIMIDNKMLLNISGCVFKCESVKIKGNHSHFIAHFETYNIKEAVKLERALKQLEITYVTRTIKD